MDFRAAIWMEVLQSQLITRREVSLRVIYSSRSVSTNHIEVAHSQLIIRREVSLRVTLREVSLRVDS